MKTVIVNDTLGGHFGCELTMAAYREQLDRVGIELLGTVRLGAHWSGYRPLLDRADFILVNGEGSIHHGRHTELIDIAEEYPAVLMNCVYEDNPDRLGLLKFKTVAVRESRSQAQLWISDIESVVVPDMAFSSSLLRAYRRRGLGKGIGVVNSVLKGSTGIGPVYAAEQFLELISAHASICTGRFHGIVACAALKIPFSAYASNTHKNPGLMKDMGVPGLYSENVADAITLIPDEVPLSVLSYVEQAPGAIESFFDKLA